MKWKKLGKIFDPTEHNLANSCTDFAQSPQTLIFDDFVRIFFSTRSNDGEGKFLSRIQFVDMDKNFKNILRISSNEVISLGNLGCYDEHGIFPLNIFRNKDKIFGYICGWHRKVSVPVDTAIGLAISTDGGVTFTRIGDGPILASSLHEPCIVGDPFVANFEDKFHMWYIFCSHWLENAENDGAPARVYKIAHAESSDGINWKRDSKKIISNRLNENECQALPTVIHFNGQYHMFFCYRQAVDFRKNKNCSYRIGYAFSTDLINWTRDDESVGIDVSKDGWDSEMLCYPHVFHCDGKIFMLYNGNEFGRYGFGLAELQKQ